MEHNHPLHTPVILEDLQKSGIDPNLAEKFGWHELSSIGNAREELKKILGFAGYKGHDLIKESSAILIIPYFNQEGKTIFHRVKIYGIFEDGVPKYLQPSSVPVEPYILPPIWKIKDKPHKPVIITEGEKKALCLHQHGFNAIGLTGVWCFRSRNSGQTELLHTLNEWQWYGRTVYVCFDSDAIYNPNVRKAEIEFALKLWSKGAIIKIIRLPQPNHREKWGADDFIASGGIKDFQKAYDRALPLEKAYPKEYFEEVLNTIAKIELPKIKEDVLLQSLSKTWQLRKNTLSAYIDDTRSQSTAKGMVFTEEEKKEAEKLLKENPFILDKIVEATKSLGHVGEEKNKKVLYLSAISSKTNQGIACYIKGQSSSGKNELADSITRLLPSSVCNKYSDISPKSLYHLDKDLSHKLLYIAEIGGTEQSDYSLRLAQSEGELIYSYPIKNPATGEFKTIEKHIPARGMALWLTTTKLRINEENQTRGFDLFIDESKEQTRRILEVKARNEILREIEKERIEKIKRIWQCAFTLIESQPVYTPYAEYLAKVFPTDKIRVRRDFQRFLTLIEANCLLHQYQRDRTEIEGKTCLVANLDDYKIAYEIGLVVLRQTLQELSPREEGLLKKVEETFGASEFQPGDTEGLISVGYEQRRKYLRNLTQKGFLDWNGKKGNQSRYTFVKSASEGVKLPGPQEIEKMLYTLNTLLPKGGKIQIIPEKCLGNDQITQTVPKPLPQEKMQTTPVNSLGSKVLPHKNEESQPLLNDEGSLGIHKVIPPLPKPITDQTYKKGGLGNEVMDKQPKSQNKDEIVQNDDSVII